jgi:hypothetical protein
VLRHSPWIVIVAAVAALVPASSAAAGIWTPIDSQTTADITAVEYQAPDRLWWGTTDGRIFRRGVTGPQLVDPAVSFNDIAFRSGGDIGLAVGSAGTVYRWNGAAWSRVSLANSSFSPSFVCSSSPQPLVPRNFAPTGTMTGISWADANTVYIVSSDQGVVLKSTNAGVSFLDVSRQADGTCRMSGWGDDVAALPGTQVVYVMDRTFGRRFSSADGVGSTMVFNGSFAVNCFDAPVRFALDAANPNRSFAVAGCSGDLSFAFSEDNALTYDYSLNYFGGQRASLLGLFGVAVSGGSALAVGNAGAILVSQNGHDAYFQRSSGVDATSDWRAASKFDASHAAVAGKGGRLELSDRANAIPDVVAPAGTISGPDTATAGQPVAYTANVADNANGSGIDPAGFSWMMTDTPTTTGNPVSLTFPSAGEYTLTVTFRDLAGNTSEATKFVSVSNATRVSRTKSTTARVPGNHAQHATRVRARGRVIHRDTHLEEAEAQGQPLREDPPRRLLHRQEAREDRHAAAIQRDADGPQAQGRQYT